MFSILALCTIAANAVSSWDAQVAPEGRLSLKNTGDSNDWTHDHMFSEPKKGLVLSIINKKYEWTRPYNNGGEMAFRTGSKQDRGELWTVVPQVNPHEFMIYTADPKSKKVVECGSDKVLRLKGTDHLNNKMKFKFVDAGDGWYFIESLESPGSYIAADSDSEGFCRKPSDLPTCPEACSTCKPGGGDGSSGLVEGKCTEHCSKHGYCGTSSAYVNGGTDCSGCKVESHECAWYGTAPFCASSCPSGTMQVESSVLGDGNPCWSGDKKLCCKRKCSWYGTAPFCESSCPSGSVQVESSVSGDGDSCWTGNKKKCCTSDNAVHNENYQQAWLDTGCPHKADTKMISWWATHSDVALSDMMAYCTLTRDGKATTEQRNKCCGTSGYCPLTCTRQHAFPPRKPDDSFKWRFEDLYASNTKWDMVFHYANGLGCNAKKKLTIVTGYKQTVTHSTAATVGLQYGLETSAEESIAAAKFDEKMTLNLNMEVTSAASQTSETYVEVTDDTDFFIAAHSCMKYMQIKITQHDGFTGQPVVFGSHKYQKQVYCNEDEPQFIGKHDTTTCPPDQVIDILPHEEEAVAEGAMENEESVLVAEPQDFATGARLAVYGFAAIGFAVLVYGAGRHFTKLDATSDEVQPLEP